MNKDILNPLNSLNLYGHACFLNNLIFIFDKGKFPKVSMLSGAKGVGKFTIINHFINYVFDKKMYDQKNQTIRPDSQILNQINNKTFSNVILLSGEENKVKVDEIRSLKSILNKSTINNQPRFIILDDVEKFNINSLNALLKIIEEPSKNNYFILINNQERKLIDTIKSRCLETTIFLKNVNRKKIIEEIIQKNKLKVVLDYSVSTITPGNFIRFNEICNNHDILDSSYYIDQIVLLTKLFKKHKNNIFIELSIFLTNNYFYLQSKKNSKKVNDYNNKRIKIIKNMNDLILYNLSLYSVTNSLNKLLKNE